MEVSNTSSLKHKLVMQPALLATLSILLVEDVLLVEIRIMLFLIVVFADLLLLSTVWQEHVHWAITVFLSGVLKLTLKEFVLSVFFK